jgi:hypothetical protein
MDDQNPTTPGESKSNPYVFSGFHHVIALAKIIPAHTDSS